MPYLQLGETPENHPLFTDVKDPPVELTVEHAFQQSSVEAPTSNSAIVFSLEDSAPPGVIKLSNPFNPQPEEDIVMVIPTVEGPGKEITAGIIFMVASFVFMCIFGMFAYLSVKRYRSLLENKLICTGDIENSGSIESTGVKSSELKRVEYKSMMNSKKLQHFYPHILKVTKSQQLSPTRKTISGFPEKPPISHTKTTEFNKMKLMPKANRIREYSGNSVLDNLHKSKQELDTSLGLGAPTSNLDLKDIKEGTIIKRPDKSKKRESKLKFERYKSDSERLSSFINEEIKEVYYKPKVIKHEKKEKRNKLTKKFKSTKSKTSKIRYTIKELVELEPIEIYQMFEYSYDDGDLLVTDLIFPCIPVVQNSISMVELEKDLTDIRNALMSKQIDPVTKIMEVFRFITFSFGVKSYNNPKIFTLPYGILVDTIIQFNLVSQVPDHLSLVIQSAFVETVIMYCINCWKFDKNKTNKLINSFKRWNIEPYIPTKLKLFKFIVTLLLQGYRSNLLKEVLIYFSMPSSPHFLQNVISEALKNVTTRDIQDLLQYLKRQLQEEHHNCCSNTEKWKHWEFTTAGVRSNCSSDEDASYQSLSKVANNKYESHMNANYYREDKRPHESRGSLIGIAYENENAFDDENKLLNREPTPKYVFTSAELPGSLNASPVHRNPMHQSPVRA